MGRPLRFVPPGSLVEVTCRTLQGRFLLRPSRDLNEIVYGVVARAAARYDVGICAFIFLSNHVHLLLVPADAEQLALFMGYVNANIAKEAGRLHNWRQRLWSRRYRAIVVSADEDDQVRRLRYLLEQGCKEGLVRKPEDWPGATSVESLLSGKPTRGLWFDRTREYEARRRGVTFEKYDFAEEETLELEPLPAWRELPVHERRRRVREVVREIEAETRQRLEKSGKSPMGRRRILNQDPHEAPAFSKCSPAPRFHASCREVRRGLELAYSAFLGAFRRAAEELKAGKMNVEFPEGSFPPRLPYCRGRPLSLNLA